MLIDFIIRYWVEVIFSLICGAAAFLIRHHSKLLIADKQRHEADTLNAIDKKFNEQSENMTQKMGECYANLIEVVRESEEKSMEEDRKIHKEIDIITAGRLSVEGRAFRNECRKLLEEDHVITFNEYEAILSEHVTYNNLGGNHEGDGLFSMVQAKYQNQQIKAMDNNNIG